MEDVDLLARNYNEMDETGREKLKEAACLFLKIFDLASEKIDMSNMLFRSSEVRPSESRPFEKTF